jgi:hypothetical protein
VPSNPLCRDPFRRLTHLGVAPRDRALPWIIRTLARDINGTSRCSDEVGWSPKTLSVDSMPQHAGVDTPPRYRRRGPAIRVFDLITGHRPGRSATSRCVPCRSSWNGLTRDRVLRGMARVAPLRILGPVLRSSKTRPSFSQFASTPVLFYLGIRTRDGYSRLPNVSQFCCTASPMTSA